MIKNEDFADFFKDNDLHRLRKIYNAKKCYIQKFEYENINFRNWLKMKTLF